VLFDAIKQALLWADKIERTDGGSRELALTKTKLEEAEMWSARAQEKTEHLERMKGGEAAGA